MPLGGKLVLKGGETLTEKKIKKKKAKKDVDPALVAEDVAGPSGSVDPNCPAVKPPAPVTAAGISIQSGNTYEKEFEFETQRMQAPKVKSTPWGSSYSKPPEILHGYDRKVTGKTAEERLDIRAASKADKFCK